MTISRRMGCAPASASAFAALSEPEGEGAKGGNRPRIPRRGFVTLSTLATTLLFLVAIQPAAEGKPPAIWEGENTYEYRALRRK